MTKSALTEEAREARNAYNRKWRKEHPGKAAEYNRTYWEKKVKQSEGQEAAAGNDK